MGCAARYSGMFYLCYKVITYLQMTCWLILDTDMKNKVDKRINVLSKAIVLHTFNLPQ